MIDKSLFPASLYGDRQTSRRAFKKIVKRAWATSWDDALADEPMISADSFSGSIVILRARYGLDRLPKQPHMRIYWFYSIEEMLVDWYQVDDARRYAFLMSAFDYLWCVLGMQQESPIAGHGIIIRALGAEILARMAPWFPAIDSLRDRCRTCAGFEDHRLLVLRGCLLYAIEWSIDQQDRMFAKYNQSFTRWLEAEKIIAQEDGKYRLLLDRIANHPPTP